MTYPESVLNKYKDYFVDYLKDAISDRVPDVRNKARLVFMMFFNLYPNDAKRFY